MKRPGQYGDAGLNPMMAAQMQHMSTQRTQYNLGAGHFPGRADDEHLYISSKAEGQWQWDRDGPKGSKPMSPHMCKEDMWPVNLSQGSDASRSAYQGQRPDSKMGLEKQMGRDSRDLAHQDMEVLEEKFHDDLMKLIKEQQEEEDIENARHMKRLMEINAQYQEKLVAIRARQATRRDEFLRKELQARLQHFQQPSLSSYQDNAGPNEYGYGSATVAAAAMTAAQGDPHQSSGQGNFDSYRERPELGGSARGREFDSRGQYPGGRAYSSGGRYY